VPSSCALLVDLQSVHRFRCYDNIHVCKLIALYSANVYSAEREMSANACTRCMPAYLFCSFDISLYIPLQTYVLFQMCYCLLTWQITA